MEAMRKDYKSDEDVFHELLKNTENVIDFDRTWNGKYEYVRCGNCNGPMLGHREEKCKHKEGVYDEDIVKRYENNMRSCVQMKTILIQYINKRKKEEIDYKQDRVGYSKNKASPDKLNDKKDRDSKVDMTRV